MSVYIYARISPKPDGKADPADSLDTQESACRDYCQRNNLEITAVFRDSEVSARKIALADRPAGAALLAALKPHDTIVVYRLDRIFRRLSEGEDTLEMWADKEIMLIAAQGGQSFCLATSSGWLAAVMQLVFAAYEPRVTAERTKHAMRRYQANGRAMSRHPPYGYTLFDGCLQPDSSEQAIVFAAKDCAKHGVKPKKIADVLNSKRLTCRNGKPWSAQTVERLLLK